jgi:arginine decarboxylase
MPGQVVTAAILEFLLALDVKEIHGYDPMYGLRVFRESALAADLQTTVAESLPASDKQGVHA